MKKSLFLVNYLLLTVMAANAQDPLLDAATKLDGYFSSAIKLMYSAAAILGCVGAVKAYIKFQRGEDALQAVSSWFGGCIFLVLAATALNTFFR